jgi:hypothetical protein
MSIIVWVLVIYKLEALEVLKASLSFALHSVAKLLCFWLYLFDAIVGYATDEKCVK